MAERLDGLVDRLSNVESELKAHIAECTLLRKQLIGQQKLMLWGLSAVGVLELIGGHETVKRLLDAMKLPGTG